MNSTNLKALLHDYKKQLDLESWKPQFFNPRTRDGVDALNSLLKASTDIEIHDEILNQLGELVKTLNPTVKLKGDALHNAIQKHVGDTPLDEYGVWVYYPWSKRLVHILDEDEYIKARTNRNMYKITPEEQETLGRKKMVLLA